MRTKLTQKEFAFLKYNDIIYQAAVHAWNRAAEGAKKAGVPYGISIITTPNTLEVPSGAYCRLIIDNSAKWNINCFDMDDNLLDKYITDNSENNFLFIQYDYKELGRSEEWLKDQIRQCQGDMGKIKREILLEWPHSNESAVFTEEELDKVYQFVHQPVTHFIVNETRIIDLYEIPDLNTNYILSCDVSGGMDRDSSVILIIHPEDFRIVGEFRNSKIDTDSFKDLIYQLMTLYFRNAILVIEKNSYGLNILDSLSKTDIEPRMYREEKERLAEKTQSNGFTVKRKTRTMAYGVDTNSVTRKQMIDLLPEIVATEYDKFVSPSVYSDLVNLERKRNGKIEHSASGHDDGLMAYLIFRWAVYYGKCFKSRFGISAIPSRYNVKIASSFNDMQTIERMITTANNAAEINNNRDFSNTMSTIQNLTTKLGNDSYETNSAMNSFFRMIGGSDYD